MQTQGYFDVLRPVYSRTGETVPLTSRTGQRIGSSDVFRVDWDVVGQADTMEEAKAKFGGRPVLQWNRAPRAQAFTQ